MGWPGPPWVPRAPTALTKVGQMIKVWRKRCAIIIERVYKENKF